MREILLFFRISSLFVSGEKKTDTAKSSEKRIPGFSGANNDQGQINEENQTLFFTSNIAGNS
jgi:hypothetical protein